MHYLQLTNRGKSEGGGVSHECALAGDERVDEAVGMHVFLGRYGYFNFYRAFCVFTYGSIESYEPRKCSHHWRDKCSLPRNSVRNKSTENALVEYVKHHSSAFFFLDLILQEHCPATLSGPRECSLYESITFQLSRAFSRTWSLGN